MRRETGSGSAWSRNRVSVGAQYAWKTFAQYAREHFMEIGDWSLERESKN